MKRVVVIGSGLGGLSTGIVLARQGFDVTILEQGSQVGGCLQCFKRRGVTFETGMHFIGSAAPGQTLHRLLSDLEVYDQLQLSPLDTDAYNVINLGGTPYGIPNGREAFLDILASQFPDQRDGLKDYLACVDAVARASRLRSLDTDSDDVAAAMRYQLVAANEVIDHAVSSPVLRDVLVGDLPLYAAQRDRTPFATHAFIMDFYNQSAYRIVGGSQRLTDALMNVLSRYGAKVLTEQSVARILSDEHGVTGVETEQAAFFRADIVVSTIHPSETFRLTDSSRLRPAFRKRMELLPNTTGVFCLYLDFKPGTMPYMNHNYFSYPHHSPWDAEAYTHDDWPRGYLYMHLCHEANCQWAQSGVIISYMTYDEMQPWIGTDVGHRGASYEEMKQARAERLLACAEQDHPGLRQKVRYYYTATPLTYYNYTRTRAGSVYGVLHDVRHPEACHVPWRTKLPGLYLAGQNVNSHGILGVLVGTMVTCEGILNNEIK